MIFELGRLRIRLPNGHCRGHWIVKYATSHQPAQPRRQVLENRPEIPTTQGIQALYPSLPSTCLGTQEAETQSSVIPIVVPIVPFWILTAICTLLVFFDMPAINNDDT